MVGHGRRELNPFKNAKFLPFLPYRFHQLSSQQHNPLLILFLIVFLGLKDTIPLFDISRNGRNAREDLSQRTWEADMIRGGFEATFGSFGVGGGVDNNDLG